MTSSGVKIYLAGRFANKAHLNDVKVFLEDSGHKVTSRWLDGDASSWTDTAIMDLEDIDKADVVALLADEPEEGGRPMQGALVELGYAIAKEKTIYIIDRLKKRTVFFSLPELHFIEQWEELHQQLHTTAQIELPLVSQ